jgi:hypothetical protein
LSVAQLAQMRDRRLVADKAARAVAQHGLFFGEDESHGFPFEISGYFVVIEREARARNLETRFTLRARTKCLSPRQIEDALGDDAEHHLAGAALDRVGLGAQPGARATPPFERSLSHSSASAPPADIRISWRRLFNSVP